MATTPRDVPLARIAWLLFGLSSLGCSAGTPRPLRVVTPRGNPATEAPEDSAAFELDDQLSLGRRHACVVRSGEVWCWGANAHDQLGDPRVGASARAVQGPTLEGASKIFAGGLETCALLEDTTAVCWGGGRAKPQPIPDLQGVVELSFGRFHCARHSEGRVRCWSRSGPVQPPQDLSLTDAVALTNSCALNRSGEQECAKEPARTSAGRGIRVPPVRIAREGSRHNASPRTIRSARGNARQHSAMPCVLRMDGTVGCWDATYDVPRTMEEPAHDGLLTVVGIEDAVQIATGRDFICGLSNEGRVACTGSPFARTPRIETASGPETVGDAVQIVAGQAHACARRSDGTVVCWGGNETGQLGGGSFEPSSRMVQLPDLHVVDLAAGSFHTCGLTAEGEVWCWGFGADGQLGDPITARRKRDFAAPVPGLPPVHDVVLLPGRTCARGEDGRVWCWGEGASSSRLEPVCKPDPNGRVQCEAVGGGGSACGGRHRGQRLDQAQPRRLDSPPISAVQPWGTDLLALDAGGRVLSFGGLTPCERRPDALRSDAHTLATVTDAAELATGGSACIRTHAGVVFCAARTTTEELVFEPVPEVSGSIALAVGHRHVCALLEGGSVTCWGDNQSGQLGIGNTDATHGPAEVAGLGDVVELAAGWFHNCARRADGTVWCWGENEGGALGDGTTEDRSRPTQVPSLDQVHAIATHQWQSCAWSRNGEIACWGVRPWGESEGGDPPKNVVVLPNRQLAVARLEPVFRDLQRPPFALGAVPRTPMDGSASTSRSPAGRAQPMPR